MRPGRALEMRNDMGPDDASSCTTTSTTATGTATGDHVDV
jgi:hypothetical protein